MSKDVANRQGPVLHWRGRCVELARAGANGSVRGAGPSALGVFPGEGIGPEVIAAALAVLDGVESVRPVRLVRRVGGAIGTAVHFDGELDQNAAEFCERLFSEGAAILCGPGGGRFVYDLRRRFDLYCKIAPLRPIPSLAGVTRLKPDALRGLDVLIVRDNSGGIYQGQWSLREKTPNGAAGIVAEHHFSYTQDQVDRIVRVGARLAKLRRGRMDVILKDGGVPTISALWRSTADRIAHEVGVQCVCLNVDYAAYLMIQHPQMFDVLVTPNLMGDVLADLGAVYLGSRGLSYSANFSPSGHAVYQTGHGAAKDLAGTDRANPVGQILSMAMMLRESYGLHEEADLVERAVDEVYANGYRTDDLADARCQRVGTRQMTELVVQSVMSLGRAAVPA